MPKAPMTCSECIMLELPEERLQEDGWAHVTEAQGREIWREDMTWETSAYRWLLSMAMELRKVIQVPAVRGRTEVAHLENNLNIFWG